MKSIIIGGLSVVLLSAVAPAVLAESPGLNQSMEPSTSSSEYQLEPFDLVSMAYQGFFKNQGIPSAQSLIVSYRTGDINAKDLVSSAVRANRLPTRFLADDDYVTAVDMQMNDLINGFGGNGRVSQ